MSFHLDLELSPDCSVWREMLQRENQVEHASIGVLGGTMLSSLPPSILASFLTHRHTQARLLPPEEQKRLEEAIASKQFTFDRNPSRENFQVAGGLNRGEVYAMTHGEHALQPPRPKWKENLPTDGRLNYLYPPDYLNRINLYPKNATTYAQGPYYESHLKMAEKPPNPHPSYKSHQETSTFRRVTTGRRHHPFPATVLGGYGQTTKTMTPMQTNERRPTVQEEKENNFVTPANQPTSGYSTNAPIKPTRPTLPTLPLRSLTPISTAPLTNATPSSQSHSQPTYSQTARPHRPAPVPPPFTPRFDEPRVTQVPSAAQAMYTRTYASSSPASSPAHSTQSGGLIHSSYTTSRAPEPLIQSIPTSYAAFAQHRYDHTSSFGSKGVFQAIPTAKPDGHGLHTSQRLW